MNSMTGYGFSESVCEKFQLAVEVKSYNNRYLDINHNMPYYLSPFEIEIDKRVKAVARRGHVEVNIRIKNLVSNVHLTVDPTAVKQYSDAFAQIAALSAKALKPQLSDYLGSEGVLSSVTESDSEQYRLLLFSTWKRLLANLPKARDGKAILPRLT